MQRLFLGRHGQVDDRYALTAEGVADAHHMAGTFSNDKLAPDSLVLSSTAEWALATARIVRQELHLARLVRSEFVFKAGMKPEPVRDVWGFMGKLLTGCNIDHGQLDVVVITHGSLVEAMAGTAAEYGATYPVLEGQPNLEFDEDFEGLLEEPERW